MRVGVDWDQASRIGRLLRPLSHRVEIDDFTDPRYYPPPGTPREELVRYFLVMVAMDHRLSRPGRPYEAIVDGELYHGADLLYRLGMKKFEEDPGFFSPKRLARVTVDEVKEWLRAGRARPPDPEVRAGLLRDLGRKLLALYEGEAYRIIVESRGMLRAGVGEGFIDRLKVFAAYQDPVEKKAFLLAKFLERRGVLPVHDPWNKEVPVDNHLARIAVRTGIVWVDDETLEKIAGGVEFTPEEDVMLRYATRVAYKAVAREAGIDPFILDDFLWMFGRRCCTREAPTCRSECRSRCSAIGGCRASRCILEPACLASREIKYLVPEHRFLDTWWY